MVFIHRCLQLLQLRGAVLFGGARLFVPGEGLHDAQVLPLPEQPGDDALADHRRGQALGGQQGAEGADQVVCVFRSYCPPIPI